VSALGTTPAHNLSAVLMRTALRDSSVKEMLAFLLENVMQIHLVMVKIALVTLRPLHMVSVSGVIL